MKKIHMRWRGRFGIQEKKFCHYFLVLKEGTGKEKNIKRRLKHVNELDGDSETSKKLCELFSLVVKCIVQNSSASYFALCVSRTSGTVKQSDSHLLGKKERKERKKEKKEKTKRYLAHL